MPRWVVISLPPPSDCRRQLERTGAALVELLMMRTSDTPCRGLSPSAEVKTMVKSTLIAVVGFTGLIALAAVCAWSREPRPSAHAPVQKEVAPGKSPARELPAQVPGSRVPQGADLLAEILGRGAAKLELAELAGMAAGSKPAVLTLEQAYLLTLIRMRNPAGLLAVVRANLFDPIALDDEARRAGALNSIGFAASFSRADLLILRPAFSRRSSTARRWIQRVTR